MTEIDRTILDPAEGDEPSAEFVEALWTRLDAAWPTRADIENTDPSSTPIEVAVFNDKESQMNSRRKIAFWAGAAATVVAVILGAAVFAGDSGEDVVPSDDSEASSVDPPTTQSTPSSVPPGNETTGAPSEACATQDSVNEDFSAFDALDPVTDSAEDYFAALDSLHESAGDLLSASSDLTGPDIENINNATSDLQDSLAEATFTVDGVTEVTLAEAGDALVVSVETEIAALEALYAEAYASLSCS